PEESLSQVSLRVLVGKCSFFGFRERDGRIVKPMPAKFEPLQLAGFRPRHSANAAVESQLRIAAFDEFMLSYGGRVEADRVRAPRADHKPPAPIPLIASLDQWMKIIDDQPLPRAVRP